MNGIMIENPDCKPSRSLPHAISHGPMTPPSPAKVNNMPSMVFVFSVCVSDTAAVMVGNMIEKKKPVTGKRS